MNKFVRLLLLLDGWDKNQTQEHRHTWKTEYGCLFKFRLNYRVAMDSPHLAAHSSFGAYFSPLFFVNTGCADKIIASPRCNAHDSVFKDGNKKFKVALGSDIMQS